MKKLLLPVLLCFAYASISQTINVNDPADPENGLTAEDLINQVLIGGDCVQVELTYLQENCDGIGDLTRRSWGYFDATGTTFPFTEGIVLSTGFGESAEGPNDVSGSSDTGLCPDPNGGPPINWPGDADLKAILDAQSGDNQSTNNATVFQFTFVPIIPDITFDFIFGSEEYENEFECTAQYRDGFAFLLRGPGIPNDSGTAFGGTNIAAVPGSTNVPVSTLSIHRDTFMCGSEIPGVNFFPEFYVSNWAGNNMNEVQFDGYTTSLTAAASLVPGASYELKIVIADRGDSSFDSAVFFRAGSFDIGSVDLGVDLTIANGNARCEGDPYEIVPNLTVPPSTTFEWQYESPLGSGTFLPFVPAEIGPTLTVSTTGNYKLIVDFAGVCSSEGEVFIEFDTPFTVNNSPDPLILCDPDNGGFAAFDLTLADNDITGGDPDLTVSYHGTLLDAQNDVLPIVGLYTNDDPYNDSVWARVESMTSSCYETVELFLEVRNVPVATTPAEPLRLCDDTTADGFTFFDLTVVEPEVLGAMDPAEFDIYYYVLESDAITAGMVALTAPDFSQAIPDPTNYLNSSNPQEIYILVVGNSTSTSPPNPNGANGCYDIVPLTLIVDPLPMDLGPFEMMLCDDEVNGSTPTDGISTFDLESMNPAVTGGDTSLVVTWYLTPADEAADNPILNPTTFQNTVTPQTIVGRVTTEFDCSIVVTMTLTVLANPTPNLTPTPLELCDDDDDGIVSDFDLTTKDAEIIGPETDVSVLYYELLADAQAGIPGTEIVGLYTNTIPTTQIVYARVTRDVPPGILPCYTIVELTLNVIELPQMPEAGFLNPMFSCDDDGDGQAVFDLTQNDVFVLGSQDPNDFVDPITYYISEIDAGVPVNAIDPATAFVSGGQIIWVRLESTVTGCARITPFTLQVGTFPLIAAGNDLFLCDDEVNGSTSTDGLSTFDLTVNTTVINQGDGTIVVSYYKDAIDQMNDVPVADAMAYQNEMSPQQEIFATAFNSEGCPAMTSFFINVDPNPNAAVPTPLEVCDEDNDGFYSFFDLTSKDTEIANGEVDVVVSYYESELLAEIGNPGNAQSSPYTNIIPFNQTMYARVTRNIIGSLACYTVVPLELEVKQMPDAPTEDFINPMFLCDDDGDGFMEFDLTLNDIPVRGDQLPVADFPITYYETQADANAGTNAIVLPNAYTNIVSPVQPIWVRLESVQTGCARVTPFDIEVGALPVIGVGPYDLALCDDEVNGSTSTDGKSTFDLTDINEDLTLGDTSLSVFFYESLDDQMNDNPIADPTAYQNPINPKDIFITVFTAGEFPCSAESNLTLRVLSNPSPTPPLPLRVCDEVESRDGISQFDLTLKDAEIIGGELDVNVLYYDSLEAAIQGTVGTELLSPYTNTIPDQQTIYARMTKDVPPAELACYSIVELVLVVEPLPDDSAQISDEIACQVPFQGEETIILDDKDPEVLNGQDPAVFDVLYFLSEADAFNMVNSLASDVPYTYNTTAQTIYVGILNRESDCYVSYTEGINELLFVLQVKEGVTATAPLPYIICDNYELNDGIGQFTLTVDPGNPTDLDAQATALAGEILGGQDPLLFGITFHETIETAEAGTDALPDVYINIINPQVIYARVTNLIDPADEDACYEVVPVTLKVDPLPIVDLGGEYRLCVDSNGNPIPEEEGDISPPVIDTGLDPDFYSFIWSVDGVILPNEIGPSITALQGGVYEVTITDLVKGCMTTSSTTVNLSSPPETYDAQVVSGAFDATHIIEATATGLGIYIFQLDNGPFQEEGNFTGVEPGNHTVTIKDANGCGSVTIELGIIDYPRFVTPNQDGYHDTWNIIGIANGDPTAKIYIFDKFGKLLKQLSPLGAGWDGTYNGNPLPSSDYWFRVEYKENDTQKEFKGHFTLKR